MWTRGVDCVPQIRTFEFIFSSSVESLVIARLIFHEALVSSNLPP